MKISKEEVIHVANLAHLHIDEHEIETFSIQIGKILEYVDTLNRIDTADIPPTSHAISLSNAFRDDVETSYIDRDEALSNAPQRENGHFLVPKVVG